MSPHSLPIPSAREDCRPTVPRRIVFFPIYFYLPHKNGVSLGLSSSRKLIRVTCACSAGSETIASFAASGLVFKDGTFLD